MPKPYAPDMDTQVGLMKLRKNAERHDIERRSRMAESVDIGHRVIAEIRAMDDTPKARELANAKETIVRLVRLSAVFSRTIQHLAMKWGPDGEALAREEIDKLVERFACRIESDPAFTGTALQWADRQVNDGPTEGRAKIRWKPR